MKAAAQIPQYAGSGFAARTSLPAQERRRDRRVRLGELEPFSQFGPAEVSAVYDDTSYGVAEAVYVFCGGWTTIWAPIRAVDTGLVSGVIHLGNTVLFDDLSSSSRGDVQAGIPNSSAIIQRVRGLMFFLPRLRH